MPGGIAVAEGVAASRTTHSFDDGITRLKDQLDPCCVMPMSDCVSLKPQYARPKQNRAEFRAGIDFRRNAKRGDDQTAATCVHNYDNWTEQELLARRRAAMQAVRSRGARGVALKPKKSGKSLASLWNSSYRKNFAGMTPGLNELTRRLAESERLMKDATLVKVPYGAQEDRDKDDLMSLYQADFVVPGRVPELPAERLSSGFPPRRQLRLRRQQPPRQEEQRPATPAGGQRAPPTELPPRAQTPNPAAVLPFGERRAAQLRQRFEADTIREDAMTPQDLEEAAAELRLLRSAYKRHRKRKRAAVRRDAAGARGPAPGRHERLRAMHRAQEAARFLGARPDAAAESPEAPDPPAAAARPAAEEAAQPGSGAESSSGQSSDSDAPVLDPPGTVVPPYAVDHGDPLMRRLRRLPLSADAARGRAQHGDPAAADTAQAPPEPAPAGGADTEQPPLSEQPRQAAAAAAPPESESDWDPFTSSSAEPRRSGRRVFTGPTSGASWNPINFRLPHHALPPVRCASSAGPRSAGYGLGQATAVAGVVAEEHRLLRDSAAFLRKTASSAEARERQQRQAEGSKPMTPAPRPR
eukprot:TRINITY_DN23985_c0_g1_i1.p1 TRINITY_DN23985_c0_g1~~TRINITY_DN23985_c0_g1_i1.p1  ORF type:complete len:616 (+),score=147.55 TRINITY_DN23985_c0_g1_i1:100-1848(+)